MSERRGDVVVVVVVAVRTLVICPGDNVALRVAVVDDCGVLRGASVRACEEGRGGGSGGRVSE